MKKISFLLLALISVVMFSCKGGKSEPDVDDSGKVRVDTITPAAFTFAETSATLDTKAQFQVVGTLSGGSASEQPTEMVYLFGGKPYSYELVKGEGVNYGCLIKTFASKAAVENSDFKTLANVCNLGAIDWQKQSLAFVSIVFPKSVTLNNSQLKLYANKGIYKAVVKCLPLSAGFDAETETGFVVIVNEANLNAKQVKALLR